MSGTAELYRPVAWITTAAALGLTFAELIATLLVLARNDFAHFVRDIRLLYEWLLETVARKDLRESLQRVSR